MKKWGLIIALLTLLALGPSLIVGAATRPTYLPEDLKMMKVELPDGVKCGYVFIGNGKWVIPPQFEAAALSFSRKSGLAAVKSGGKYGFINVQGQMVIPPQFDKVGWSWADDRMDVKIGDQTGFIDHTGKMVIDLQPGQVSSFSEGLASVRSEKMTRVIDEMGNTVFEVTGWCGYFKEGLAPVTSTSSQGWSTGFIDRTGQMVIAPQAGLFMSSFSQGRAPICIEGKYGFIDVSGKVVIPAQYDAVLGFTEGLAPVLVDRKIGFDLSGKLVLPTQYEYPDNKWQPQIALGQSIFVDGLAKVKWNGKYGIIDKNGNWIVQPIYDSPILAYFSRQNIVFAGGYYYTLEGKMLDHYVNDMQYGEEALKNGDPKGAAPFFRAALKINPGDEAATWKLSQTEGKKK